MNMDCVVKVVGPDGAEYSSVMEASTAAGVSISEISRSAEWHVLKGSDVLLAACKRLAASYDECGMMTAPEDGVATFYGKAHELVSAIDDICGIVAPIVGQGDADS
jgi:hypothetical protein